MRGVACGGRLRGMSLFKGFEERARAVCAGFLFLRIYR
jgi:hypothetical protein